MLSDFAKFWHKNTPMEFETKHICTAHHTSPHQQSVGCYAEIAFAARHNSIGLWNIETWQQ